VSFACEISGINEPARLIKFGHKRIAAELAQAKREWRLRLNHAGRGREIGSGAATGDEILEAYDRFVEGILRSANAKRQKRFSEEQACLRPLPAGTLAEYREFEPVVSSQSLIRVKKHAYSVPSRLIGHTLRVELYEARLRGVSGQGIPV
jgi:hypothetical protein